MATATGTVRTERVRGQFFLPAVITGFLALMLGLLGFEQFLNAMTLGAIYALIALGYTMVYGIIELINFAHGDVFMVATFVSIAVSTTLLGQTGAVLDIHLAEHYSVLCGTVHHQRAATLLHAVGLHPWGESRPAA